MSEILLRLTDNSFNHITITRPTLADFFRINPLCPTALTVRNFVLMLRTMFVITTTRVI